MCSSKDSALGKQERTGKLWEQGKPKERFRKLWEQGEPKERFSSSHKVWGEHGVLKPGNSRAGKKRSETLWDRGKTLAGKVLSSIPSTALLLSAEGNGN